MKTIGLVGGIASGKSSVARLFAQWGATVLDADQMGHDALEDPDVRRLLVERWGAKVLAPDGRVRRDEVARRVFGSESAITEERRFLERTLHPRIRRQVETELARLRQAGAQTVVIDAPLLIEAGWTDLCDEVVFVDAPPLERKLRAQARGWSAEHFSAREASQLPIERKQEAATYRLSNEGSKLELADSARRFWEERVAALP